MEDYLIVKELGDGSFGTVIQAQHRQTGQVVAIKRMKKKFSSWDKVCELREFKALRILPSQSSIISLFEAFLMPQTRELYFVFEYMEGNLYQLIKDRKGKMLNEKVVRSITFQILEGLYIIHSYGIFHRDMKPENILISARKKITSEYDDDFVVQENDTKNSLTDDIKSSQDKISDEVEYIVKVGDFGLAREIKSKHPYTDYVSTRWYRAPEVLLKSNSYSSPIDLWAVGTILAELFTLKPLFPGQSEIDQLFKISEVLGSPKSEFAMQAGGIGAGEWKEGIKLAKNMGFSFPQTSPQPLSNIFPQATPPYFLEFLSHLLRYDSKQRLTALDALKHPYFTESNLIFTPPSEPEEIKLNKGMEKKRKNDNFLFRRGGNLSLGDKKNNNRYTWTKASIGQNKDTVEPLNNNGPASHLPPLDIEAANSGIQKEFVLPTIKAISPFSSDDNVRMESIEQSISKSHQEREHGTIIEEHEYEEILSISRPHTTGHFEQSLGENSSIENAEPIPIMRGKQSHGEELYNCVDVSSRHKSNPSRSFQFPPVHKRDRSSATYEIDQMVKEIEEMNRGIDSSQAGCISPRSVDLKRYQLPDDVMKFFGAVDDSSPVLRRSCSKRDFMKVHRRYSSTSATQEMSPTSFDFQHQKKPSVASSQDHSRNDSGFSTNSTNNTSLEDEKEKPSYATKVYGQHLKTWQQICQENGISSHDSPLDDNFSSMINNSFQSPVIPEFQVSSFLDISGNDVSQNQRESPDSSPTSANNSFFSNLKAAVKSHAASPTKRYGIFNSSHENANATSLKSQTQRRRSNSGGVAIVKEGTKSSMAKKRSFIFDTTSISANSLFSSKDNGKTKESTFESKRISSIGGTGGEKKDKKLSSSPRLFATLGAKFPGGKGGDSNPI